MTVTLKHESSVAIAEEAKQGTCKQCGVCCAFISIPPFRADELDRLPKEIQQVVDWYTRNHRIRPQSPVPCYFFDVTHHMCLIHQHKPQACRDFEPGGLACRTQRGDLLEALNAGAKAAKQWARHYTRVVDLAGRIQQIGEFRRDDIVERS
ncbi:MAG: YkgJ family cysteine cluster protein [Solirubrobacterales bacterium]